MYQSEPWEINLVQRRAHSIPKIETVQFCLKDIVAIGTRKMRHSVCL